MSVPMTEIVGAIRAYFEERNLKYDFYPEKNDFKLRFRLETKLGSITIHIRPAPLTADPSRCGAVLSYAISDLKADGSCMAQMSEYLHRANDSFVNGHFELDPRDGEIRFKHYLSCETMPGTGWGIRTLTLLACQAFEEYGNGILAISMGLQTPKEAVAAARSK